jgi:hypothetical protein
LQKPLQEGRTRGAVAYGAAVLTAVVLAVVALAVDGRWVERHILPEFFHPRDHQLRWLVAVRVLLGAAAVALVWPAGPRIARWAARKPVRALAADVLPTLVAVGLALAVSEVLLRHLPWFSTHQLPTQREPLRRRDPVLGWAYAPDRAGRGALGGRTIEYAFDPAGHRVPRRGATVDYARPSVLFVGESIIGGHGVTYEETIPARVGARLGLQPANLAVGGYATDQMLLRLRYERPCALVVLFMPSLFHRNLEHDRPHLDADLAWRPASDDPRLVQIVRRVVPYRSDGDLADGMRMTRGALAEMVRMAQARGATPLILVPELTAETGEEAAIREAALQGLPSLKVRIDPSWRLRNNRHPDARAGARLADAVTEYLEGHGLGHGVKCPR